MTLWIFGDSYADGYKEQPWFWSEALASKLNVPIKNYALSGTGLEVTYTRIQEHYKEFQKGDCLVICLTQFHRQYFIPEYPQISIAVSLDNVFITPKEIKSKYKKAFNLFTEKLYNENNPKVNFKNFLFFLQHLTDKLGLTTIGLPCFEDVNLYLNSCRSEFPTLKLSTGHLFSVSTTECIDEKTIAIFYELEARANHMCRRNHTILSDKLFDTIVNNTPIDLNTGFHTQFLSREVATNIEFAQEEFLYPDKMIEVNKYRLFDRFIKRPSFP